MAWCFGDEATPFTESLLSRLASVTDSAIVPALWLYEVVNVTGLAVRKGRITEEKANAFLESLADLPIEIEEPTRTRMFVSVRALVGRYKLTAYDASYLELAIRHDLPIAALDNALTKAALEAGVNLVQL
jgi:predicted nucleic acid-binding protein